MCSIILEMMLGFFVAAINCFGLFWISQATGLILDSSRTYEVEQGTWQHEYLLCFSLSLGKVGTVGG